jgi:sulfate transport system substrate-binding protein
LARAAEQRHRQQNAVRYSRAAKGNPKNIRDFPDLAQPGIQLIHPDPVSSGGAQWSILSIYGSELKKSEAANGAPDASRAVQTLQGIWKNVISTPASAREARTQFETGYGDALIPTNSKDC